MYMGYQFISTVNRQREKNKICFRTINEQTWKKHQEYTYNFFKYCFLQYFIKGMVELAHLMYSLGSKLSFDMNKAKV